MSHHPFVCARDRFASKPGTTMATSHLDVPKTLDETSSRRRMQAKNTMTYETP